MISRNRCRTASVQLKRTYLIKVELILYIPTFRELELKFTAYVELCMVVHSKYNVVRTSCKTNQIDENTTFQLFILNYYGLFYYIMSTIKITALNNYFVNII